MTKQLGATLDQRGAIMTELGDAGVADALVWTGRDAAGNYARNVILPLAPFAQMAFNSEATANTSTNATNASTSVSVEALNKSFTLPPGTWNGANRGQHDGDAHHRRQGLLPACPGRNRARIARGQRR